MGEERGGEREEGWGREMIEGGTMEKRWGKEGGKRNKEKKRMEADRNRGVWKEGKEEGGERRDGRGRV